jgi:hypothetical protein
VWQTGEVDESESKETDLEAFDVIRLKLIVPTYKNCSENGLMR